VIGAVDAHAGPVTASDQMVGAIPVRCFTVEAAEGSQLACFDAEGVPAALDGGDGRLERVELDGAVTDEDFVPPPSESASSTTGGSPP
jgi:hypothetical protein